MGISNSAAAVLELMRGHGRVISAAWGPRMGIKVVVSVSGGYHLDGESAEDLAAFAELNALAAAGGWIMYDEGGGQIRHQATVYYAHAATVDEDEISVGPFRSRQ